MADRYWVGGTGDSPETIHWSETSGGPSGASLPTSADDVYFDTNSGIGNGNGIDIIDTITCNNFTSTTNVDFRFYGIHLNVYGNITLEPDMKVDGTFSTHGAIDHTLTTNGCHIEGIIFSNCEGTIVLQDNLICDVLEFNVTSFDANDFNITSNIISFYSYKEDYIYMGSGDWILFPGNWSTAQLGNFGSMIIVPETSTLILSGGCSFYTEADISLNNVVFTGICDFDNGNYDLIYSNLEPQIITINDLVIDTPPRTMYIDTGMTIRTNTFSCSGTEGNLITLRNTELIEQPEDGIWYLSVSAGTIDVSYCDLSYSWASGGAIFNSFVVDGNVDSGSNTGWNFYQLGDRYWVGDSGNWNDRGHWSLTSGGPSGALVPTSDNNVIFDSNSFSISDQITTLSGSQYCKSITWENVTNSPTFTFSSSSILNVSGNITFSPNMSIICPEHTYNQIKLGTFVQGIKINSECHLISGGIVLPPIKTISSVDWDFSAGIIPEIGM